MSLSISRIITVNIARQTTTVATAGFGAALIMGAQAAAVFNAGEYVREYTSASAMTDDGFNSTDSEYLAAVAYFSQTNKPTKCLVGVANPVATIKDITYTGTLTAGTVSVVVNGTEYSEAYATSQTATMSALATAIQADSKVATCSWDDPTQKLTITSGAGHDVSIGDIELGTGFSASAISIPTQATSSFTTDLSNIRNANDDWYILYLADYGYADVVASLATIETLSRMQAITVYDAQAKVSGDTTNVAYLCSNGSYARSFCLYTETMDGHSAAAWIGGRLPVDPGGQTWKFKTLNGITADTITETEATNLETIECNWYSSVGVTDITSEGVVGTGEFIDVIRLVDWTEARILEGIYSRLVSSDKIPFTDVGFSIVDSEIRQVLRLGIANDGYVDDEDLDVTIPPKSDLSSGDVAARALTGVTFYATLAGAVHSVAVSGTVSV